MPPIPPVSRPLARALAYPAALLLAAALAAACSDDPGTGDPDAGPVDAAIPPSCLEAQDHADLEWIQDNIFTPSCAGFAACHQGAASAAQGLNLEAGNTEANLVGVPSARFPEETLVIPGDPAGSYLMVVLGSYPGELSPIGTMPPNNPELCIQKRQAIERWIMGLPVP